jgi:hypothetical protein
VIRQSVDVLRGVNPLQCLLASLCCVICVIRCLTAQWCTAAMNCPVRAAKHACQVWPDKKGHSRVEDLVLDSQQAYVPALNAHLSRCQQRINIVLPAHVHEPVSDTAAVQVQIGAGRLA